MCCSEDERIDQEILSQIHSKATVVAVPQKTKDAMAKAQDIGKETKEKYPRNKPVIKMNLRYKPMPEVTQAPHFFKYVPKVFKDAINFDFTDKDYALNERDKQFLKDLNERLVQGGNQIAGSSAGQKISQVPLSEAEFERCIDSFEKVYQKTKNKQDAVMLKCFKKWADPALVEKIDEKFLTVHLMPYWKKGKRFTRKFWENPDANDPDGTAAFRKRNDR